MSDGAITPNLANKDYPSTPYAWYTVGLLLVVYTVSFIDRQIMGLLGPQIIRDFKLSDTQFGLLSGMGFAVFYTLFGLICARISDSRSRVGLIAIGLALWSLMTAASGLARSYSHLFLLRIGVGVGEATLGPAANSIVADSFPKEKLSTALSVYSMGLPIGSGLAFLVGGLLIEAAASLPEIVVPGVGALTTWQKTFLVVGLPGLPLALIVMRLKEPHRRDVVGDGGSLPVSEVFAFLKTRARALTAVILGVSVNAAIGFGTFIWIATYMGRYFQVPSTEVGLVFGLIALTTGPVGLILFGRIADRYARAGVKDGMVRTLMIIPMGFFVPSVLFPLADDLTTAWILLAVANFFLAAPTGVAYAAMQVITPNQMRGQIVALYILSTNIIGYGGGAFLFGYLSDQFGSLQTAFLIFGAVSAPLCLGLFIWGRKAYGEALVAEEERIAALQSS